MPQAFRSANQKKDALFYFSAPSPKDLQIEYSHASILNCFWEEVVLKAQMPIFPDYR